MFNAQFERAHVPRAEGHASCTCTAIRVGGADPGHSFLQHPHQVHFCCRNGDLGVGLGQGGSTAQWQHAPSAWRGIGSCTKVSTICRGRAVTELYRDKFWVLSGLACAQAALAACRVDAPMLLQATAEREPAGRSVPAACGPAAEVSAARQAGVQAEGTGTACPSRTGAVCKSGGLAARHCCPGGRHGAGCLPGGCGADALGAHLLMVAWPQVTTTRCDSKACYCLRTACVLRAAIISS